MRRWQRNPVVVLALAAASLGMASSSLQASAAVWRLVDAQVNPDGKELGAASSGITAEVSSSSITWAKKAVDRGRVVEDYRVRFTFGNPPGELRSGQVYRIAVQGSLEGTWPEGRSPGNSLKFTAYGGLSLRGPYGLDISPSLRNGMMDVELEAADRMSETVALEAGGLNWCPGCRVVWTYRKDPTAVPPAVVTPPPPPPALPPQRTGMTACDAWDVRLTQPNPVTPGSSPTFTEWRGRWIRARFAPCYQATWESLSTGQRITRGVCPRDEGQNPSFWSDDGAGGRITYFTGTFGGPAGQIRGEYDYEVPGSATQTGTWIARCYDPGPFPAPTW